MSAVVRHVVDSIAPASPPHGDAARRRVAAAGVPILDRLAYALGAAQHTPRPRGERRAIVVVAGDHGCGDPGVALGADHPTAVAAHAIAGGTAALAQVARASRTPIVLVDAGAREAAAMPATAIRLGRAASRDLLREPAMTVVDATLGLEAGIALAVSLAEGDPLAVLAIGALGLGADVASAALLGAATRALPSLDDAVAEQAAALGVAEPGGGVERLARFGGAETAVLAGLILAAASMNVPVLLDGYATGAAALAAASLAPAVVGYLIAPHFGTFTQPQILRALGLVPLFELGLGHGDGTGAAMVIPWIDQVAAVASATTKR